MEHNPARLYRGPVGYVMEPFVRRARGHGWARRHQLVWKMHRAVWLATRSNRVVIEGHDMLLDRGDALALASGSYEPEETAWYRAHVRPGDLVVEVGANIGYFALILAQQVGPEGKVISFEPDPDLNKILRRNVTFNGYPQVDVREAAVAAEPGTATFFRSSVSTGDHRLFAHGPDDESFPVRIVTLDDELAGERRVDLLKMDIQGAEPLALAGAAKVLAENPPRRILMEFWPHGIVGMGNDPRELVALLRHAGYTIDRIDGRPFDEDEALRAEMTPENLHWVNLVCTHKTAEEIA
ncbi:hypothetical protein GCM10011584_32710 [Nocardioides phosphati]|uniref:Methyltransferase FkbM domain-containing protein n=1 Tax=Nocardioides phosphati TaxID=1867775 RepID=A0ABQ2NF72_9ACTN|nr:FkbM family methyltransferase [Nocardioides phosphati]GGO93609.1 hypothetical protein GCM10011584_32710 [Nocardioides phosphati]